MWHELVVVLIKLDYFQVRGSREAMTIQDWAAQRCTISYRAPELFNIESHCIIDERTDIWVKPYVLSCKLYKWPRCETIPNSYRFFSSFVVSSHSSSHLAVCFTPWWCWRGRMTWCFRRGTVWLWLFRIQSLSHSLAGECSNCCLTV